MIGRTSARASWKALLVSLALLGCKDKAPLVPSSVAIASGDAQTGAPGAALAAAPQVLVADARGLPVAGAPVSFEVTSGGGTVQRTSATTDASGHASCGAWTLGGRGLQTLVTSVPGLLPVTFAAAAVSSSPGLDVSASASWRQRTGDRATVEITVSSPYVVVALSVQLASAVSPAQLDCGVQATFPAVPGSFFATCALDALPYGGGVLLATATDGVGNSSDAAAFVLVDHVPSVVIASPDEGALARPGLPLRVSCTDDSPQGCTSLEVRTTDAPWMVDPGSLVVSTSSGSISQDLDLSRYEGYLVQITATGVGGSGRVSGAARRTVYVESSPALSLVATVPGKVWDAAGSRVLYLDTSGAVPALTVRDLVAGSAAVVESHPDFVALLGGWQDVARGFLTPGGAIYTRADSATGTCSLLEWNGGAISAPATVGCGSLQAAGGFAAFQGPDLVVRDLASGTDAAVGPVTAFTLAENGAIALVSPDCTISRWRAGTSTALRTFPSPYCTSYPAPQATTDGQSALYAFFNSDATGGQWRLALHDGAAESLLATVPGIDSHFLSFEVAGLWAAYAPWVYAPVGFAAPSQVWRHGAGGENQVTFFAAGAGVLGLLPDGTILLKSGIQRFLAAPGSAPRPVGSSLLGRAVRRDGRFLVLIGPHVLAVSP